MNVALDAARPARWQEQIYIHHAFDHPQYAANVMPAAKEFRELPLRL